jgi:hypothetical protein
MQHKQLLIMLQWGIPNANDVRCLLLVCCCPPRLRAHKVWWSSKTPANATLTVATVTTLDRLYQLEAQCSSWAGPLSAVVYVPVVKGQDQSSAAAEKEQLADAGRQVMKLVTR